MLLMLTFPSLGGRGSMFPSIMDWGYSHASFVLVDSLYFAFEDVQVPFTQIEESLNIFLLYDLLPV